MSFKTENFLHRYSFFLSICTVLLLCAGALVTSTGSGLAVPDWPLSYGRFFPPMVGGILFEHGHRLVAGAVAVLTLLQAILYFKLETRRSVRVVAYLALFAVILQALLGGLTVILRLPPQVSIAHACLAQIFFCLVVTLTLTTSRPWHEAKREEKILSSEDGVSLSRLSIVVCIAFFIQLLLGATMRHLGAGLAIPDFPSVFGGIVPESWNSKIAIHYAHRIGAGMVITLSGFMAFQVYKRFSHALELVALSGGVIALLAFQFMLGAMVVWLKKPVPVTMLHLATGAICLGLSVALALQIFRIKWVTQQQ